MLNVKRSKRSPFNGPLGLSSPFGRRRGDAYADVRRRLLIADTYIVTGDSTRAASYSKMIPHIYQNYFNRLGINVVDNSGNGDTAADWEGQTGSTHIGDAISATPGTGSTTILEYSLGLNDWNTDGDEVAAKAAIIGGIEDYLAAKPDAVVFLADPVRTGNATRNIRLKQIYSEISNELNLPLVDIFNPTNDVWDGQGDKIFLL